VAAAGVPAAGAWEVPAAGAAVWFAAGCCGAAAVAGAGAAGWGAAWGAGCRAGAVSAAKLLPPTITIAEMERSILLIFQSFYLLKWKAILIAI
jgi:hypothetical protein